LIDLLDSLTVPKYDFSALTISISDISESLSEDDESLVTFFLLELFFFYTGLSLSELSPEEDELLLLLSYALPVPSPFMVANFEALLLYISVQNESFHLKVAAGVVFSFPKPVPSSLLVI
tara:strand:- start:168 stop:527 length:360 start_codon:yes stop_codon:yes gene_type:complete